MRRWKYFNNFMDAHKFTDRVRGRMTCIDEDKNLYLVVY